MYKRRGGDASGDASGDKATVDRKLRKTETFRAASRADNRGGANKAAASPAINYGYRCGPRVTTARLSLNWDGRGGFQQTGSPSGRLPIFARLSQREEIFYLWGSFSSLFVGHAASHYPVPHFFNSEFFQFDIIFQTASFSRKDVCVSFINKNVPSREGKYDKVVLRSSCYALARFYIPHIFALH